MFYSKSESSQLLRLVLSMMWICVLCAILTACAHQTPTPATSLSSICERPRLTFSRLHDTDDTIKGIKAQNAARDIICGQGK